eukprot:TRINITY_DN74756_c0_g1_i1.p1 TRINITY_DN74756_c0_g1~~TRINITY_DN74756_c0_g1_i1.p1  ORF type:complete len:669 (-),score=138.37 TRINITY_DN74756_c0_g1_i1:135-2141(-)
MGTADAVLEIDGKPVSLDNLIGIGYTKLQDLLALILANLGRHDTALGELREKCSILAPENLRQMVREELNKTDVDDRLASLELKTGEVDAKASAVEAKTAAADNAAQQRALELDSRLKELESKVDGANLSGMSRALDELREEFAARSADAEASKTSLQRSLDEVQKQARDAGAASTAAVEATSRVEAQQTQLRSDVTAVTAQAQKADAIAEATNAKTDARLATVEDAGGLGITGLARLADDMRARVERLEKDLKQMNENQSGGDGGSGGPSRRVADEGVLPSAPDPVEARLDENDRRLSDCASALQSLRDELKRNLHEFDKKFAAASSARFDGDANGRGASGAARDTGVSNQGDGWSQGDERSNHGAEGSDAGNHGASGRGASGVDRDNGVSNQDDGRSQGDGRSNHGARASGAGNHGANGSDIRAGAVSGGHGGHSDASGGLEARVEECFAGLEELRSILFPKRPTRVKAVAVDETASGAAAAVGDRTKENGGAEDEEEEAAPVDFGQMLRRVEESLQKLQELVKNNLQPRLDSLSQKEALDVQRLNRENLHMQITVNALLAKGAAGTARCLSCFDKRSQENNKVMMGSDGKLYKRRPSNASAISEDLGSGTTPATTQKVQDHGGAGAGQRRFRQTASVGAPSLGLSRRPASAISLDTLPQTIPERP